MKNYRALCILGILALPTMLACSSGSHLSEVAGVVTVDGKPVDSGTIHFQSNATSSSSGGTAISNGNFKLSDNAPLQPGEYAVVLQAYRKTGRIYKDPQQGDVEMTEVMRLADSPKTVQLTPDNAGSLTIDFSSAK